MESIKSIFSRVIAAGSIATGNEPPFDMSAEISFEVSLVTQETNWQTLAPILVGHDEHNILNQCSYKRPDARARLAELSIWGSITHPTERVFKATAKQNGFDRVVGFGSIIFRYDGIPPESPDTSAESYLDDMDGEFCTWYSTQASEFYPKHMSGKKHVVWGNLCVLPEFKEKGVESELFGWAFEHFRLDKEEIWTMATMDEMDSFLDHGWKDIDFLDIDLSQWKGKTRGYGVFRVQAMVRKPGVILNSVHEEIIDPHVEAEVV